MDISAAAFTHCSFVVTRLDRGSIVHDSVAKGSDNLKWGGNTEHILRLCIGDAYVRDRLFRAPHVLTHPSRIDSKGSM